jgi:dissimilatory sulfite reductase (desulfoviridin) alpha/beta subunit
MSKITHEKEPHKWGSLSCLLNRFKKVWNNMEKRIIEMLILGALMVFIVLNMVVDWLNYNKYKEVIEILKKENVSEFLNMNYCKAWCYMYG